MILAKDFEDFVKLLNRYDVAYMIVGGYALAFHGKPRHTGDLDIWINVSEKNANKMIEVINHFGLSSMGFSKEDFLKPGYITQIGYPPLRIDILNSIDGINFNDAITDMQKMQIDNDLSINYIGLNDFIKNKQASGRSQDIADIKEIRKKQSLAKVQKKIKGKNL